VGLTVICEVAFDTFYATSTSTPAVNSRLVAVLDPIVTTIER